MIKPITFDFRGLDNLSGPLNKIRESAQKTRANFNDLGASLKRSGQLIRSGVADLREGVESVSKIGLLVSGGLGYTIKQFEEFQFQMSTVKALSSEITENEFAQMINEAKRLGTVTSFSAMETAKGFEYLAQAGLKAGESIKSLAPVLRSAESAGMDLGEATTIILDSVSALSRAFKDPSDRVSNIIKLSDMLSMAAAQTNVNVKQLGEAITYGGNSLSNLGIKLPEIIAMMGKLGDAGLKGSAGGTAIAAMFNHLTQQTPETMRNLRILGINLRELPFNDMPKFIDIFTQRLKLIKHDTDRAKISTSLFGVEGRRAFENLSSVGGNALRELSVNLENSAGASSEMAKVRFDNLHGAFLSIKSALQSISIEIGSIALTEKSDVLKSFVHYTRQFAFALQYVNGNLGAFGKNYNQLSSDQKKLIQWVRDFKEGFLEGIEAVKEAGKTFFKYMKPIFSLFMKEGDSIAKTLGKLTVFVAAMAPIGLILLGIGAAITSIALPLIGVGKIIFGLGGGIWKLSLFIWQFRSVLSLLLPVLKVIPILLSFMLTPIGAAVTLIGGAIYLIVKNWEKIKSFFFGDNDSKLPSKIKKTSFVQHKAILPKMAQLSSKPLQLGRSIPLSSDKKQTPEVSLKVKFDNVPRGVRVDKVKDDIPVNLDLGHAMFN